MQVKVIKRTSVPTKRNTRYASLREAFLALEDDQALFVTDAKASGIYSAIFPHRVTVRKGVEDGQEGYYVSPKTEENA